MVGTGLNMHREFPRLLIANLAKHTDVPFKEAPNHFEALGSRDAIVEASGALRTVAHQLDEDRQRPTADVSKCN